ncbi:DsbA family protein [Microbacterium fluvii]|uniref:DsbA family protein n=1 Tax=Microbacterium fluvii TaxID=415215 RepID=A0ABW2HDH5_9MICO|nr:DsbA family protein [Microbacterium fluvii]MCU4671126.1 DsbA family protein [Microbacterium fluvii]
MATAARKTNWFAIWISLAVVVVLVLVAGLVIWMNNQSSAPGEVPDSAGINQETGAIAVGDGSNVLDTYIDFMCPICGQFEELYGETIEGLVNDGSITLNIHPISILDRASMGTEFSTRSANAAYCVAEAQPESSLAFLQAMFANQPEESTEGLTDAQILDIAAQAGVTGIDDCVADQTYADFVATMTDQTPVQPGASGIGTPTVLLNDEFVTLTGDPQADLVDALQ